MDQHIVCFAENSNGPGGFLFYFAFVLHSEVRSYFVRQAAVVTTIPFRGNGSIAGSCHGIGSK
jgi:hypothetical protein